MWPKVNKCDFLPPQLILTITLWCRSIWARVTGLRFQGWVDNIVFPSPNPTQGPLIRTTAPTISCPWLYLLGLMRVSFSQHLQNCPLPCLRTIVVVCLCPYISFPMGELHLQISCENVSSVPLESFVKLIGQPLKLPHWNSVGFFVGLHLLV